MQAANELTLRCSPQLQTQPYRKVQPPHSNSHTDSLLEFMDFLTTCSVFVCHFRGHQPTNKTRTFYQLFRLAAIRRQTRQALRLCFSWGARASSPRSLELAGSRPLPAAPPGEAKERQERKLKKLKARRRRVGFGEPKRTASPSNFWRAPGFLPIRGLVAAHHGCCWETSLPFLHKLWSSG